VADRRIRVNAAALSPVCTPMVAKDMELFGKTVETPIAAQRVAEPKDVATVFVSWHPMIQVISKTM
jgi:NAD(P)-dependent dehydrogenase (short-subunit alcohol dehydrogenase family)